MPVVDWQLLVLRTITGARTPVCLLAAINSVEAVTPPFGAARFYPRGWIDLAAISKNYFHSRNLTMESQLIR
jgi:hypothetical protein